MRSQIAKAQNAAYLEARANVVKRDTWQPNPLPLDELTRRYGRLPALAAMIRPDANSFASIAAQANGWSADAPPEVPNMLNLLAAWTPTAGKHKPWFTVTARDLAFVFYNWGLISRANLQASLEHAAQAEVRRNPRKARWFPIIPKPAPPKMPTPVADHLARLRTVAHAPENAYLKRLEQLNAFQQRHSVKALQRDMRSSRRLARPFNDTG